MPETFKLRVNGEEREVSAEPNTPLQSAPGHEITTIEGLGGAVA